MFLPFDKRSPDSVCTSNLAASLTSADNHNSHSIMRGEHATYAPVIVEEKSGTLSKFKCASLRPHLSTAGHVSLSIYAKLVFSGVLDGWRALSLTFAACEDSSEVFPNGV